MLEDKKQEEEIKLFQRLKNWLKVELPCKNVFLLALISTFIFGICAHGFAFFNLNVSHDSLYEFFNEVSASQKFGIGRFIQPFWRFLTGEAYVLPWLAGIIGLTFLACGVYLICKTFSLSSVWQVILLAGIFSVNVTVTSLIATYMHDFTGYMFAFFLATWIAYTWVNKPKKKFAYIQMGIGAFVLLGTYQAYINVTLTLMLLSSLIALLKGEDKKRVFFNFLFAAISLIIAAFVYLFVSLIFDKLFGNPISGYNDISHLLASPKEYIIRFMQGYGRIIFVLFIPYKGLSIFYSTLTIDDFRFGTWLICIVNLMLFCYTAYCVIAGVRRAKLQRGNVIFAVAIALLLPLSMNFVSVLVGYCSDLMMMGDWLYYVGIILLLRWYGETVEEKSKGYKLKHAFMVFPLSLFIVFNGIGVSNTCYVKKELDAQVTLSAVTRLITKIEDQEGYVYGETEVAIVGSFDTVHADLPLFENVGMLMPIVGMSSNSSLTYLQTWEAYFDTVMRYPIHLSDKAKVQEIQETEEVKSMPTYPKEGCISNVNGIIVVKLSEITT